MQKTDKKFERFFHALPKADVMYMAFSPPTGENLDTVRFYLLYEKLFTEIRIIEWKRGRNHSDITFQLQDAEIILRLIEDASTSLQME